MRRVWLSLALFTALCGCARHVDVPPAPVSVDTPQSAAQQARAAQADAIRQYKLKAYAKARSQALIAMGLLKMDGTDPAGVKAMRLLAAKAGAHVKDPNAGDELRSLAQDKALDTEGKKLAAALPRKTPTAAPVNPANVSHPSAPDTNAAAAGTDSQTEAGQRASDIMHTHRSWQGQ